MTEQNEVEMLAGEVALVISDNIILRDGDFLVAIARFILSRENAALERAENEALACHALDVAARIRFLKSPKVKND